MKAFGFEVSVRKTASPVYDNRGSWWPGLVIREPFTGAWQRNIAWTTDTVLAYNAVYACVTLIASDVGKLRPKLMVQDPKTGIWSETESAAFSPVLRKPNHFQNHIQFKEWWFYSKLIRGNAYALKERDQRGVVVRLYLLDPSRVKPLVSPDGSVFYDLGQDNLSGLEDGETVPASEIIHDRMNCIFHPLVGTSPIFACGSAANLGLQIESSSGRFFGNDAQPGGILTAPGVINEETASQLSARWKQLYSGDNAGKVAVLGNGLKFDQLRMTSVDAEIIEHMKLTDEAVARVFHVPAFKIGAGPMPTYSNGEILDARYYSDCLQSHIEHWEATMDGGLGLDEKIQGKRLGVELDLDGLLRMDTATQYDTLSKGIGGAFLTPNEARRRVDLKPLPGGDTVYLQQQNYSLAALDERDRSGDPFGTKKPEPAPPDDNTDPDDEPEPEPEDEEDKAIDVLIFTGFVDRYEKSIAVTSPEQNVTAALLLQAQSTTEALRDLALRELPAPHITVEGPTINVAPADVSVTPPAVNVTVEAAKPTAKSVTLRRADGTETEITVKETEG